jgi:hypothetical protein
MGIDSDGARRLSNGAPAQGARSSETLSPVNRQSPTRDGEAGVLGIDHRTAVPNLGPNIGTASRPQYPHEASQVAGSGMEHLFRSDAQGTGQSDERLLPQRSPMDLTELDHLFVSTDHHQAAPLDSQPPTNVGSLRLDKGGRSRFFGPTAASQWLRDVSPFDPALSPGAVASICS